MTIDNINHISILNSSLHKIYNNALIGGKLKSIDLYVLNLLYKILNNSNIIISTENQNKIIEYYNNLLFSTNDICNLEFINQYKTNTINTTFQADFTDCNEFNPFAEIFYWQEDFLNNGVTNVVSDVVLPNYLDNKPFDTYVNFNNGKLITYSLIGNICFLATNTLSSTNLIIIDYLNNDVTHTFDKTYIPQLKATLYVSQNIYTLSDIQFKIKK